MKELNIAVCDDEEYELNQIENMLSDIVESLGCQANISVYRKSRQLIDAIAHCPQYFDILFLDMYIDEKIGFDIAEIVRKQDYHCAIVFVTAFADRMAESFRYLASAYLIKPVDLPKLESAFQTALSHLGAEPCFHFHGKEKESAIPFRKIMYLEGRLRNIDLFTDQCMEPESFPVSLADVKDTFPKEFFHLCHKSFFVNFSYIRMIDRVTHEIILHNGKKLPVSRTYYQQLLKDFTEFHSVRRVEHTFEKSFS